MEAKNTVDFVAPDAENVLNDLDFNYSTDKVASAQPCMGFDK
jgi:hypothetical protein